MSASGTELISVTRFIKKMRGGSQPILAQASDGNLYVVKFSNNLQGPNVLFNESAGTTLYGALGLPVPQWTPLIVSRSFVSNTRGCWIETATGLRRPAPGLCFGSRYLGGAGAELFEILPGSRFSRVANSEDFWLAWLVDACGRHSDNRQAVFEEGPDGRLKAWFIDHGHMFGGPNGELNPSEMAPRYLDQRIYPSATSDLLAGLRKIVFDLDVDQLWKRIRILPEEWKIPAALRQFENALERLSCRARLNSELETALGSPRTSNTDGKPEVSHELAPDTILRSELPPKALRPSSFA